MRHVSNWDELNIPNNYKGFLEYFLNNISNVKKVDRVILFGSCARGQARPNSDIDLFVMTKGEIGLDEEFYITDDCPPSYENAKDYYKEAEINRYIWWLEKIKAATTEAEFAEIDQNRYDLD